MGGRSPSDRPQSSRKGCHRPPAIRRRIHIPNDCAELGGDALEADVLVALDEGRAADALRNAERLATVARDRPGVREVLVLAAVDAERFAKFSSAGGLPDGGARRGDGFLRVNVHRFGPILHWFLDERREAARSSLASFFERSRWRFSRSRKLALMQG